MSSKTTGPRPGRRPRTPFRRLGHHRRPGGHARSPRSFSPVAAAVILGLQAVVFAIGAVGGPRTHPYGRIFATFVAPRLGPVTEREPVPPLKFAQFVGFVFAVAGAVGFAVGWHALGLIATAFALVAAFLNAAFGICLGCQIYPLVARLRRVPLHPA